MNQVPANANKKRRAVSCRTRDQAYAELVRLDTHGLDSCSGDCGNLWPLGRCEHHEVEARLGYTVDPGRPSDLAIGHALQLLAEQSAYESSMVGDPTSREAAIREAHSAGQISWKRCVELLQAEWTGQENELRSAAFEIAPVAEPRRRWRRNLDDDELDPRRRLELARMNEGWTKADVALYETLTEPAPLAPLESLYTAAELRWAKRLTDWRRRQATGTLPRNKPVSQSDRRRIPTYVTPPLHVQLGVIPAATQPAEFERAVRDLRRNAKRRGLHPPNLDRRRKATDH
jgi:hypothetical protein